MDLSPLQLVLASALVFFGAFVQSAFGFGLSVVAAPLLYLIEPTLVPGPLVFLALVLSMLNTWRNRAGLAIGELGSAIAGRVPGTLLALWLLSAIPTQSLSLLLTASVLLAVLISLAHPSIQPTRRRLFAAGMVSGFMGTSTSIGGPPMALLYQNASGSRVRANLSGFFIVGSLVSLLGLAAIGRYGVSEFLQSLVLLPAALVGFVVAGYSLRWVDRGALRPALLLICSLSALGVLIEAL